jgi:hypothetical protein
MPMPMPVAAARIARSIQNAERTFDQAVADTSAVIGELAMVRAETGLEASSAQAAFVRLAKAQSLLIDAQNEVLRAHAVLRDFARERADIPDECPVFVTTGQVAA